MKRAVRVSGPASKKYRFAAKASSRPKAKGLAPKEVSVEKVLLDLRQQKGEQKAFRVIGKDNTRKAAKAAKLLEKSASKTLPEALELAETRESFHRDLGAKFQRLSRHE